MLPTAFAIATKVTVTIDSMTMPAWSATMEMSPDHQIAIDGDDQDDSEIVRIYDNGVATSQYASIETGATWQGSDNNWVEKGDYAVITFTPQVGHTYTAKLVINTDCATSNANDENGAALSGSFCYVNINKRNPADTGWDSHHIPSSKGGANSPYLAVTPASPDGEDWLTIDLGTVWS